MAQVRDFLAEGPNVRIHPVPFGAVTDDGTRVLQPTPSEPVVLPPVLLDPPDADPEPPPVRRPSRPMWPWIAAAVLLVLLAALGAAALVGGNNNRPSASPPSSTGTTGPTTHHSPHSPPPVRTADAGSMEQFVTNYLSTVTSDRHAAWAMLTPAYQRASGGFAGYQGFWRTIDSATVRSIHADPASLQVTYDVDYLRANGSRTSELVTLQLVRHGSSYLIANQLHG